MRKRAWSAAVSACLFLGGVIAWSELHGRERPAQAVAPENVEADPRARSNEDALPRAARPSRHPMPATGEDAGHLREAVLHGELWVVSGGRRELARGKASIVLVPRADVASLAGSEGEGEKWGVAALTYDPTGGRGAV